jgi:hypothetical protein
MLLFLKDIFTTGNPKEPNLLLKNQQLEKILIFLERVQAPFTKTQNFTLPARKNHEKLSSIRSI